MLCGTCGFENPAAFRFCASCGRPLVTSCPACGADVLPGARFCGACGRPISAAGTPESSPTPSGPGERRRVTVLFADVVGFSTLAEYMDPEDVQLLMTEAFAALAAEVTGREGTVEKYIGDAVVAIFGAPRAHEDDPWRAVEAALEMQKVIPSVAERFREVPSPLRLRIGINSGLVVSSGTGDGGQAGVMGDAVNVAARLQEAAGPNEIFVGASVWRRVRHRFDAERVGRLSVKGREQSVEAYRIITRKPVEDRRSSAFVGRRQELGLLEFLWDNVVRGNTHVVSVVGEPGVGKTRLLAEFPVRRDALDIRVACTGERAYGPFLELIQRILGRIPQDLEDLRELAARIPGIQEDVVLLMAAIVGLADAPPVVAMADEHQKRQVFSGVWQFLMAARQEQPALLVLDDLHWADRSSLDLLSFLLERLAGVPVLFVLAYRPGFEPAGGGPMKASHTAIRLDVLNPEESAAMARGLLDVDRLPPDVEEMVLSRAEGNPFFIEELLEALIEVGSLSVVDGTALLGPVEWEIPDTVEGTIVARVDRLAPRERAVLQTAAVVGGTLTADVLESAIGETDVRSSLEQLAQLGLLSPADSEGWRFRHALIQEVIYGTLLHRKRKEMHRSVAEALEVRAASDLSLLEALAEHYARADVPDKARQYAVAAGDAATERMGFVEARARYETAIRLWGEGDEQGRINLLMKLGWAALVSGDPPSARTALIEAEAGYRALSDAHGAGTAKAMLGRVYFFIGEMLQAEEALAAGIELLESDAPTPELVRAYVWLSILNAVTGRGRLGVDVSRRGLDLAEKLGLEGARSHFLTSLGVSEATLGDVGGIDRIRRGLELAERTGEVEAIGRAYLNLSVWLCELYLHREGIPLCRRGRDSLRSLGAPSFEWVVASNQARMLVEVGQYGEAEALCREVFGPQRMVMVAYGTVFAGIALSQALVRPGRYDEARSVLNEVLPLARRMGGGMFLCPLLTIEAELEAARGHLAAAHQAIVEAVGLVASPATMAHAFVPLVMAAKLLTEEDCAELLSVARSAPTHPSRDAHLREAEGLIRRDPSLLVQAARLYEALELPYQQSRALLEAGEREGAAEIVRGLGVERGPLAAAVR